MRSRLKQFPVTMAGIFEDDISETDQKKTIYLKMESDSHPQIVHAPNFQIYAAANRGRLRTMYPFLSSAQINGKLKDAWKQLEVGQKNRYTKTILKVTPEKQRELKKPKENKTVKAKKSKKKKTELNEESNVCATPEYVNPKKISDFRQKYDQKYENDFEFSDKDMANDGDRRSSCGSFFMNRHNKSKMERVQNEAHKTPLKKQGILKTGSSKKRKDKVSFSELQHDQEECCGATSADRLPMDVDEGGLCASGNYNSSDEDNAVLIRREDSMVDPETQNMCDSVSKIVEKVQGHLNTVKQALDVEGGTGLQAMESDFSETCNRFEEPEKDIQDTEDVFKSTSTRSVRKSSKQRKSTPLLPSWSQNKAVSQVTPDVAGLTVDDKSEYTTPQMDGVLQKLAIKEVNKAPHKRRQSRENAAHTKKCNSSAKGNGVTRSLMVTKLERDTIAADVKNVGNIEIKDTFASTFNDTCEDKNYKSVNKTKNKGIGKRKAKRNRALSLDDQETLAIAMDPSGDASQNKLDFDNNNNTADGARGMIETQTEPAEEHNFTGDHPKPLKRKSRHSSRSPLASPLQAHKKSKTSDKDTSGATTPLDACISNRFLKLQPSVSGSQSSFEGSSASSPSYLGLSPSLNVTPESTNSSLSSFRRLGKQSDRPSSLNPALERVLEGLRSTRVTAELDCPLIGSDRSSPCLLSPAMSGISELSSTSSRSQSRLSSQNLDIHQGEGQNVHTADLQVHSQEDKTLCDMFADVTPPERKTSGQYKTTRMLASGGSQGKVDLTQWFQEDTDDFLFH
ncbi:uncharacterized protein LOC127879926 isoform X2 [Dreissena polymorpha]|uniref:uncharacterized protein LOC127879926 isoform X2 n=1 Tax=Dreissena polymorpha TaxID=45954 RepID=UPI0022640457|nr:uncharacterized protein LOC127879926 isoform X2 [Dreissena polymorpha]